LVLNPAIEKAETPPVIGWFTGSCVKFSDDGTTAWAWF